MHTSTELCLLLLYVDIDKSTYFAIQSSRDFARIFPDMHKG